MVVPLLDAVLGVEIDREEARRMDHVQKSIRLGDTLLYRHQYPSKERFSLGFRSREDARMASRDQ